MNLQNLYYFVVTAEELNISQAAKRLYLSQQALSNHIKRLEEELDIKLFQRTPRLSLTYAGSCTLRSARLILNEQKKLLAQIDDIRDEKSGKLCIGTTYVRSRILFPRIIPDFMREYPDIRLETVAMPRSQLFDNLLKEKLDMIIINQPEDDPVIESIPLTDDSFCAVIPHQVLEKFYPENPELILKNWNDGHSIYPAFFGNLPIILPKGTTIYKKTLRYFSRNNVNPNIVMELNDVETAFHLCEKGVGITFSYNGYAASMIGSHKVKENSVFILPIPDEDLAGHIFLCHLKNRYQSKIMKAFVKMTQDMFLKP